MESFYDYKKYYILYVDDEQKSLKYFKETFGKKFSILTASNAAEGFETLKENKDNTGILITDQRMPGEKGIQFLEKARRLNPRILRILVTAYSDLETAIESVNTGAIYKYVTKPWDIPQLEVTLRRGIEFFIVQRERDQLLTEKISSLYNVMMTDRILSLGILATGLNHHLRNSVAAVKTFLEMAPQKLEEKIDLEQLRNPGFWKDYYQKVQSQMDKVAGFLSGLWEPSEPPVFDFPDKVKLQDVVQEALQRAKPDLTKKEIKVENHIPEALPELKVDQKKFSRLFELLLRDEAAILPQGGKVWLAAKAVSPGEIQVEIRDNGPGLPREALRSVFDPFSLRGTYSPESSIYLITCFFIVYHHGGRITAEHDEGKGNTFTLTFPLTPSVQAAALEEKDFIGKVLLNEAMWEKLMVEV